MPRNGDGSGDNGPIDLHEIVHGADGDDSLQHTKKVVPMPDVESGDALPGMSASGGASAPLSNFSEQFGTNEPKKSIDNDATTTQQGQKRSEPHDGLPTNNLEQKFTKLDEDEVNISTASTKSEERDARAQRRADAVGESRGKGDDEVKEFGGHADVEELHGAATLEGKEGKGGGGSEEKGEEDGGKGYVEKGGDESSKGKESKANDAEKV